MLSTLPAPAALARWCVVLSAGFALILTSCDRQPPTASLAPGQAQLAAELDDADEPVDREKEIRPGIAIIPERTHRGRTTGTCSLAFLVTDGQNIYGTTVGHCYEVTISHPSRMGYLDYRETILPESEDVYTAADCNRSRLCSSGLRIGKFVYAIQNSFDDPVDNNPDSTISGIVGRHNPKVPVGDFALIRLHPRVRWSPKMCHFGGPLEMVTTKYDTTTVVATRFYGIGFALGYQEQANAINQGWTGVAVPGRTPSIWSSPYTFTGTFAPEFGASGGPIMTVDGRALGIMGGAHYLDRFDTNLERAGHYLGKNFRLLTAPLVDNPTPVGNDPNCQPRNGTTLIPS